MSSIRTAEARALQLGPDGVLMAAAAQALAERVARYARGRRVGAPIIALVGPGNNGGDALLAALLLRQRGFDARAWLLEPDRTPPHDAAAVWSRARQAALPMSADADGPIMGASQADEHIGRAVAQDALFIDGLFGIGLSRPLSGKARRWVEALNDAGAAVIAVDVPSGINVDTGAIVGEGAGVALRCVATVTFIADKPGLHTGEAVDYVGAVDVASLGVAPVAQDGFQVLEPAHSKSFPLRRMRNAHKGRHGTVRLVGGAPGMRGALLLAARGAQRAGAGKVYLSSIDGQEHLASTDPELMSASVEQPLGPISAVVVGCGMGQSPAAVMALRAVLQVPCPLVLDADALNLIVGDPSSGLLRAAPTLMTPHPLEAARLLQCSIDEVQRDRIGAARALAASFAAHVVLKGAGSVCSTPDGRWCLIASGTPALAVAGSGDVLAGTLGGLLAQGLSAWDALLWAVWAHGRAAARWSALTQADGELGLGASELPDWIRSTLNAEYER